MRSRPRPAAIGLLALMTVLVGLAVAVSPASAFNPVKSICASGSPPNGLAGNTCNAVGGGLLTAGKQLIAGHVGGAVQTAVGAGVGGAVSSATTAIGLAAIGTWVLGGAGAILHDTATVLGKSSAPQLSTTWFSSTYWRMAGIAAVLTLPFLFAAAVQALIRSDLGLLGRAAFGYLPLAMLAVGIAAPLTMLLLAATDQLCALISSAAGNQSAQFLDQAGAYIGALTAISESPFLAFLVGLFTVGVAFALWIELVMREAAVYVVVLMLPLAFAALAWPARRIWAIRAVEVLVALILSKFAIVAVLSLGGAAFVASLGHGSITAFVAGAVLIMLATFSPWALIRLVPLAELASGAAGPLRGELRQTPAHAAAPWGLANRADEWAVAATAAMRRDAGSGTPDLSPPAPPPQPEREPGAQRADQEETHESAAASSQAAGGPSPAGRDEYDFSSGASPAVPDEYDFSSLPTLDLGGTNWPPEQVWPPPGNDPPSRQQ